MMVRRLATLVACAVLSTALLSGCLFGGKKKSKDATASKQHSSSNQPGKAEPHDTFETMSDPPFSANTRFAAGQLAESQGSVEKAIGQYREALKLDPNHPNALFRLGALYTDQKKYDEAIPIWQRYIEATGRSPAAYKNLALCYEQAGMLDQAEKTYRAGLDRDPQDSSCRVPYGLMLARQGRTDEAIAQLQTVLSPAEVHYDLGAVCEEQGKKELAKAYYQRALELDPKFRDARARLAALK